MRFWPGALAVFALVGCSDTTDTPSEDPLPECRLNSDCPTGQICEEEACVEAPGCEGPECPCDLDSDCLDGEHCDADTSQCVEDECEADADCALGQICAGGVCVTDITRDTDRDGVPDLEDNCPEDNNADQEDLDGDELGDACDEDDDNDTVPDLQDNCPQTANTGQEDLDNDGQGDACEDDIDTDGVPDDDDNCPNDANAGQEDLDADGQGDACDPDADGDDVLDVDDNCPGLSNADQNDTNNDGLGDACSGTITVASSYGPDFLFGNERNATGVLLRDGELIETLTLDERREVRFDGLPTGEYTLNISREGFIAEPAEVDITISNQALARTINITVTLDDLTEAALDWTGEELTPELLDEIDALGINRVDADLSGARLIGDFAGKNLRALTLDNIAAEQGSFVGADFTGSSLRGASLPPRDDTGESMADCILDGADMTDANASATILRDASLVGTILVRANITATDFSGADMTDADLTDAQMCDINLLGAILDGVTCPDGTPSDDLGGTCDLHLNTTLPNDPFARCYDNCDTLLTCDPLASCQPDELDVVQTSCRQLCADTCFSAPAPLDCEETGSSEALRYADTAQCIVDSDPCLSVCQTGFACPEFNDACSEDTIRTYRGICFSLCGGDFRDQVLELDGLACPAILEQVRQNPILNQLENACEFPPDELERCQSVCEQVPECVRRLPNCEGSTQQAGEACLDACAAHPITQRLVLELEDQTCEAINTAALDLLPGLQACGGRAHTIASLRNPSDPLHPEPDTDVTVVAGIITAIDDTEGIDRAWIQTLDGGEFSGMFVFSPGLDLAGFEEGDIVTVRGLYTEFNDLSEIIPDEVELLESTGAAPAPQVIPVSLAQDPATIEPWESVLVRINNITVTNANPDDPRNFGEFVVADTLRVDDLIFGIEPDPQVGNGFESIQGVMHFSFDNYKLLPRRAEDVVVVPDP